MIDSAMLRFKAMTILSNIFFFFFFFHIPANTIFVSSMEFIQAPSGGPESFAFDSDGYAYTGVNDGRILKYQGSDVGFVDFAYASPTRDKGLCDGKNETALGLICGRALGLAFDEVSNELYIADAYHGLHVVGPEGGPATQLLSSAEGIPFKWLDGLDVDQKTGNVYITEMSNNYNLSQRHELLAGKDGSGRLIEYNPHSKSARVLLNGLEGASGVGVSNDGTFVLVSEHTASRITKYWLKGPKANTAEVLLSNVTEAGNIRTDKYGWFFIACNIRLYDGVIFRKGIIIDDSGTDVGDTNWGWHTRYTDMLVTEFHETIDGEWYLGTIDESFGIVLP